MAENVGVSQLCLTGGIIELPLVVQTSGPDLEGESYMSCVCCQ